MKQIKCKIKGHDFMKIETGDIQIKNFECTHCNQQFTTDGYGRIVKLNQFWEDNNRLFLNYFREKSALL